MTPGECVTTERIAARLYDIYSDAVGGVSAVTGQTLPSWDQCNETVKKGWIAVADAVSVATERTVQDMRQEPGPPRTGPPPEPFNFHKTKSHVPPESSLTD